MEAEWETAGYGIRMSEQDMGASRIGDSTIWKQDGRQQDMEAG